MAKDTNTPKEDDVIIIIFRNSFRHPKTGKIIRRKDGGPIPIKIRVKR